MNSPIARLAAFAAITTAACSPDASVSGNPVIADAQNSADSGSLRNISNDISARAHDAGEQDATQKADTKPDVQAKKCPPAEILNACIWQGYEDPATGKLDNDKYVVETVVHLPNGSGKKSRVDIGVNSVDINKGAHKTLTPFSMQCGEDKNDTYYMARALQDGFEQDIIEKVGIHVISAEGCDPKTKWYAPYGKGDGSIPQQPAALEYCDGKGSTDIGGACKSE